MSFYLIDVPVADLRKEPQELLPKDYAHHPLRESQLLFGEKILCHRKEGSWLFVEAIEQERYTLERGWHGYPGWVHSSEAVEVQEWPFSTHAVVTRDRFSYGTLLSNAHAFNPTHLRPFPQKIDKQQIVSDAFCFLGAPYLWGGRASHMDEVISSVDCSSLINLLYRAQGINLPRDAHDQALKLEKTHKLEAGDPLYLSKDASRITHVILYCGDHTYIEAPESGKNVRLLKEDIDLWQKDGFVFFKDRETPYLPFPKRVFNKNGSPSSG